MTGRVVGVNFVDGELTAAILTDGMNTEIQCNVGSLQVNTVKNNSIKIVLNR